MIVTPNLYAGWTFEGNANEIKGMSVTPGTGITYGAGKLGLAFQMAAAGTGALIGAVTDFTYLHQTGIGSVSFWLKINNHTANQLHIIAASSGASTETGFILVYDNRALAAPNDVVTNKCIRINCTRSSSGFFVFDVGANNAITDNNWNHVHINFNQSGGHAVYVNGVAVTLTRDLADGAGGTNMTRAARLGALPPSNTFPLNGAIDDLRFYEKVLDASDRARVMLGFHPLNG